MSASKVDRRHQNPGGARKGSGAPLRTIKISLGSARTLKALLRAQIGGTYSTEAAARWVEQRIEEAWSAYDAQIQADVEQAIQEGEMAEYYGISAAFEREFPRQGRYGSGTVSLLHWQVFAGPCATRSEAEEQGRAALPKLDQSDIISQTWHQNFMVVSRSRLRHYRINPDQIGADLAASLYDN